MQIICTTGPESSNIETLRKLYDAGMHIVRLNFSHVDLDWCDTLVSYARAYCPNLRILQDLQGVKLRVAPVFQRTTQVRPGDRLVFCPEAAFNRLRNHVDPDALLLPIHFEGNFAALDKAREISMKDATMQFKIIARRKQGADPVIDAEVVRGGVIRPRKALNAPGMDRSDLRLTAKDRHDVEWGLKHRVDIICLSFVCNPGQVQELKSFVKDRAKSFGITDKLPEIWVKIETREGVDNFARIRDKADGIILARGDLAPEIGIYEVPEVQFSLLDKMMRSKKPFFIATQVLGSLVRGVVPTRSEVNDIYYCMTKKVTGFMLGEETGISKYPVYPLTVLKEITDRFSARIDKPPIKRK